VGSLLAFLQANPAVFQGFLGGVLGAIVVEAVSWRWSIVRRRHDE
jgi:hypothetical protein